MTRSQDRFMRETMNCLTCKFFILKICLKIHTLIVKCYLWKWYYMDWMLDFSFASVVFFALFLCYGTVMLPMITDHLTPWHAFIMVGIKYVRYKYILSKAIIISGENIPNGMNKILGWQAQEIFLCAKYWIV